MLTLNVSAVLNEILEVKKDFSFESATNHQNTISGRFNRLMVIIKALPELKKNLRSLEYSFQQADLHSKMKSYAELNYMAESSRNDIEDFLLSNPVISFFDRVFRYYAIKYIAILNEADRKFFKLTYPESKSLDNPEYVAQLDKDYANAPQYSK